MQKQTFRNLLFIAAVTSANWLLSGCGGGGSGVATPTLSTDQVPFTSAVTAIANSLSIPATFSANRFLLGGPVVTDAGTSERFSYQGSAVKYEVLTSTGAVLYAYLRSDFTSTPLSGLVVGSPPEFAHAFNALFSNGSLLTGTSMWGAAA